MALLEHNTDKEKQKKKLLTRGPKVEVNNKVNRNDMEEKPEKKTDKS